MKSIQRRIKNLENKNKLKRGIVIFNHISTNSQYLFEDKNGIRLYYDNGILLTLEDLTMFEHIIVDDISI